MCDWSSDGCPTCLVCLPPAARRPGRGDAAAAAPRPVQVSELELTGLAPPDVRFCATVSAGTYLRSLARDVGEALGCGAHLAALTRTRVGPFPLADGPPSRAPGSARFRSRTPWRPRR